jgi:uncharacterized Zn-finger protein
MPSQPFETVTVHTSRAACDGSGGTAGHPRVFLHIDHETGQVVCPYCSRTFVLAEGAKAASGH